MFLKLLSATVGEARAADLLGVLTYDERLDTGTGKAVTGTAVTGAAMAGVLHFLLFEELLKRAPTALTIAGEALDSGEQLALDHAAMATLDGPFTGSHLRGRHHLGSILEPLGYAQIESHEVAGADATAHVYAHRGVPGAVPDFIVLECHVTRHDADVQAAVRSVFGEAKAPSHVRVQASIQKLKEGQSLDMDEAAEMLRGMFAWFGRQHVPPLKSDYVTLSKANPILAWMSHEGQALSHMSIRVAHLSATMDLQMRQGRHLQPVKTSLDQTTKLAALVPDRAMRPFRSEDGRISEQEVNIANLAFIERGSEIMGAKFEPGLF